MAAALALACAAATAPQQPPRPSPRPADAAVPGPASGMVSGAATRPATRPAPPPVRSDVGQRAIRRNDDAAAPATQPAGAGADSGGASAGPARGTDTDLPKVAGALAVVLALIFALRAGFKRAVGPAAAAGSSRAVQLLSRTVLAPRQHLMLVRVGRRLIVVADSGGQMSALSEITDPDEVASLVGQIKDERLAGAAPAFGGLLGRLRQGMDAGAAAALDDGDPPAAPHGAADEPADGPVGEPAEPGTRPTPELSGLLAKVRLISHQFKGT